MSESSYDSVLVEIAEYVAATPISSEEAYSTARLCFADALACGLMALESSECTSFLDAAALNRAVADGCRVAGTSWSFDAVQGAFTIGVLNRWLDYNDTWLAQEWGHPSDNLAAILAVADRQSRERRHVGESPITIDTVLTALIKAYEIQGVIALANSFNAHGFDHVVLVKVASVAVTARLLGGGIPEILSALSQAWMDGAPLRAYRHAPNTGPRKSWAAGDAAARAVFLAQLACRGEIGYPRILTAPIWGVQDVMLGGAPLILERPLASYVMENILFKIAFPAEFHAQTAVEAGFKLHNLLQGRWNEITKITIETQAAAARIIDKKGPLTNFADRDHCIQYMVAVALLYGELTADHYGDVVAADPRIDALRALMEVRAVPQFSSDYLDPDKRSISNAVTLEMRNGSKLGPVIVEYPLGHKRRRIEAIPLLYEKVEKALQCHFPQQRVDEILGLFKDLPSLRAMDVDHFTDLISKV